MTAEPTRRRRRLSLALLTLVIVMLGGTDHYVAQQRPSEPTGRSATLLPDGRWLFLGGQRAEAVVSILDPATGVVSVLAATPHAPRAWHTSTLLADGGVLVVGGVDVRGQLLSTVERLDLGTETFELLAPAGLTPRTGHSATLLSDGRVLLAGGSGRAGPVLDLDLWDPARGGVPLETRLLAGRRAHRATLLPDGRVLLSGGIDSQGRRVSGAEVYDPSTLTTSPTRSDGADSRAAPTLAASSPYDTEPDVPQTTRIALRFSHPLDVRTVNATTVRLASGGDVIETFVIAAEQGRLAFVTPSELLRGETDYELTLVGLVDQYGRALPPQRIRFKTARPRDETPSSDDDTWVPDQADWRAHRPPSPWQSLPPLRGPAGVTALAGQVLRMNGAPLAEVTLDIEGHTAVTDRTGRFLLELQGVAGGYHELVIDGATASTRARTYGLFEARAQVHVGQTSPLPFTIWMPRIDTRHAVAIPSPTVTEVVVTTPLVPGLELRLPPNTVIRDRKGQVVRELSITAIPLDRTPFPLPGHFEPPVYFTVQPGGAYVYVGGYGGPRGARVIYPNTQKLERDIVAEFWQFDPEEKGWYIYGTGAVSANGRQVAPHPGVGIYEFTGAMMNGVGTPPGWGFRFGGGRDAGDPVDLGTGLFVLRKTDLHLPGVLPLALTRTYRPNDSQVRPFGRGATHPYAMFLWSANQYQEADLILPDGARVHYVRTSPGTGFLDAVFEHTASPTAFYRSVIRWRSGAGWDLRMQDGTVYVFGENAPLQSIRDRFDNGIVFTWSSMNTSGHGLGNLLKVTSSNGRFIEFTYDGSNRVTQAKDNSGRTVGYQYDASGRLWKVTDPIAGVTEYTYDTSHRMLTIKDARGIVFLTNQYDANGRVSLQTQADSTTYQFAYTLNGSAVTQADVTNPRGYVDRSTFNADGFETSLVESLGTGLARTTTFTRQAGSNHVTRVTDPLGRETAYVYDGFGQVTSLSRLDGTADEVTTTFTYESAFHQIASVTDPLSHTTTFDYDSLGRLMTITDPLTHETDVTYNEYGLPLTVTDALSQTTVFGYTLTDLTAVTDPVGGTTTRVVDQVGRSMSVTNPLGQRTQYAYDGLNRVTRVTDARGAETDFSYDANSNLLTLEDARNNVTTYTYNTMDRVATRTDPLTRQESYTYNGNGSLATVTDRKSQVTTYAYDALDRPTQTTFHDTATAAATYDTGDRVTQIVDSGNGTITRTWDGLDRLTSETTPEGVVSYTYDAADRRATMTVAGQTAVSYTFDNADRPTGIAQGSTSVALQYDDANRRTSLTLTNGIVGTTTYDAAGQITAISYALGGTPLGNLSYSYDLAGNRLSMGGSYARTGLPAALGTASYDAANQITSWGGTSFTYDANGNLTSDGARSYTWNARNQLTALSGGASASFGYDGMGRRRARTVSGTARSFLYDGLDLVQELASGTPTSNLLTGLEIDEVFRRTDSAGARDLLTDALGSTWALTDGAGTVQTSYTYEPFGATTTSGASSTNSGQFTGRENDGTGLHFHRLRYYHPAAQRFASEDPLEFLAGDVNLHAYVANAPTKWIDPLGLFMMRCPDNKSAAGFSLCGPGLAGLALSGPALGPFAGIGAGASAGRAAAAAARRATRNLKFDGPLGTRIAQVRWNSKPMVRLDYGPIPGSHGADVVHVHIHVWFGKGGIKTHWPIYPPGPPR